MPSQCCFWCPAYDMAERKPGDRCPTCNRLYETPLVNVPGEIGEYQILEPVGRGFYSAVYRAKQRSIGRTVVLKVVPVAVQAHFNKDWQKECEEHATIAEDTELVADITLQFTTDVAFGADTLACHIAVLDNVVGPTLEDVFKDPSKHSFTPRMAAQVAIDLFEILHHFEEHQRFHNDLHAGNVIVQRLTPRQQRTGAVDPMTRAVAIDLGSVLDASKSDAKRLGDQQHIARHMAALAAAVGTANTTRTDVDVRLVGVLQGFAEHLAPAASAQRVMTTSDAFSAIAGALKAVDEPWSQPLSLQRFGDSYNAQTMESWHVPELWFDPENQWMKRTAARGPQVITGMRGCGKTILLRALHFHARAVQAATSGARVIEGLQADDFVGIYASCQKLLNPQHQAAEVRLPFERLYVAYLRDAVQVFRHLRALDADALVGGIHDVLAPALQALEMPASWTPPTTETAFDQALLDLQLRLVMPEEISRLKMPPSEAFAHLADVIRAAAPVFGSKYVLFLLDDVSTRYLSPEMVRTVISGLLFQHPHCAFRITTEAQALQRVLRSPGGTAPADPMRDYEEFDLGNEVYRLLQEGSMTKNMQFVSEILRRRGQRFQDELYRRDPIDVLGAATLEEIATEIANSSPSSPDRKRVYRGLRAMQAVCVGDLGDVVKLYEKILLRASPNELPVPAGIQTTCFLEHSANLMHFLNRRDQHQKGLALAFAQAAGELLTLSARGGNGKKRLRQYTKLYVRVDSSADYESIWKGLLDLLDAGVFVYDGGSPRTKTRDDDPVLQFKLSYRKMLGLASSIGLSDRDRFELSGEKLKRWLSDPQEAKRILLESESKKRADDPDEGAESEEGPLPPTSELKATASAAKRRTSRPRASGQLDLLTPEVATSIETPTPYAPALGLTAVTGSFDAWRGRTFDVGVVALGFEERTLESARRMLESLNVRRVILVQYTDDDQGASIRRLIEAKGLPTDIVKTTDELSQALQSHASVLVDTSGLSKPYLFVAVRDVLSVRRIVSVLHTFAEHHYPRNEDLEKLGVSADAEVPTEVLAKLGDAFMGKLGEAFMGEVGPYVLRCIQSEPSAPERWRALIASASPKNDRLLALLDTRAYEATRILVPPPTTPRRRIAWASAEFAASAADANVGMLKVDTNDITGALAASEKVYADLYYRSGANVEIGLTGSKIHAVAAAALAAAARIAAVWYVAPQDFNKERFTTGVRESQLFDLTLPR